MLMTVERARELGIDVLVKKGIGEYPVFKIAGPVSLPSVLRSTRVTKGSYSYTGNEEFSLDSLLAERKTPYNEELTLYASLVPKTLSLVRSVVSVTLPLEEAFTHFEGMEEWFMNKLGEGHKSSPSVRPKEIELPQGWGGWGSHC